jgi:hypothetical protein
MRVGDYVTDSWGNKGFIIEVPENNSKRTHEIFFVAWTYHNRMFGDSIKRDQWCIKGQLKLLSEAQ